MTDTPDRRSLLIFARSMWLYLTAILAGVGGTVVAYAAKYNPDVAITVGGVVATFVIPAAAFRVFRTLELDPTDDHATAHAVGGEWEFDVGDHIRDPITDKEKVVIERVYDVDDEECRYVYRSDDREYWIQARGWAEHDHELKDGDE